MNVAIIPARGRSKRIPRKNIKPFCGKPIISYPIEAAIASELFNKVIVSTDDKEITETAKKYGAEVPFIRPSELADDYTGTDEVLLHSLSHILDDLDSFNYACCIYPATPLLKVSLLSEGLDKLKANHVTSCFPVVEFCSSIYRALEINEKEQLRMIWPENKLTRTQDLPNAYYDAGQFYWVDIKKYLEVKCILSNDSIPIILPGNEVVDIDTDEDWRYAELLYTMRKNELKLQK